MTRGNGAAAVRDGAAVGDDMGQAGLERLATELNGGDYAARPVTPHSRRPSVLSIIEAIKLPTGTDCARAIGEGLHK